MTWMGTTGEIERPPAKRLSILGSTGSIGLQALEVAEKLGFEITALAAGSRVAELERQIRAYRPRLAVMFHEDAAADLKHRVRDLPVTVLSGMEGLCAAAALEETEVVLNAVVGMVGLLPTLSAIEAGKDVALANKETLVAGGFLVMEAAARRGVKLLPVDSEHSAIFQCLQGAPPGRRSLRRLILTASGGPFFGRTAAELENVTLEDALRHPNWSMGAKITIDSATMMNKGLELIEARWLFDLPPEQIEIVVHRESVVHSLIEYEDHSVIAQMGLPDMRIPIQYALTYPERVASPVGRLRLEEWGKLTFFQPDDRAFPAMTICREAISRGGLYPAAVNAANEEAVALFREGRIGFTAISRLAAQALERTLPPAGSVEDVLEADREARRLTREHSLKL